jgi:hypothetical protein
MFSDPAFTENRENSIHRWVPWIAGFSANFVADVIRHYAFRPGENTVVFDPFAGVGTTLVEAKMKGFDVGGNEINPYAAMACRSKLNWDIDLNLFKDQLSKLAEYVDKIEGKTKLSKGNHDLTEWIGVQPELKAPSGFRTRAPFFDSLTERKMLLLKEFIYDLPEELKEHFKVAFGAILVKHSNYAYGPSLGRKSAMGIQKIRNAPVGPHFLSKVQEIYADLVWVTKKTRSELLRKPTHYVLETSVFRHMKELDDESISLVITSPPYLNNYHYPRNTRPQLYWLDMAETPSDIKKIEWESFGKFWQSVRGLLEVELEFSLPELEDVIEEIRGRNPHKGTYGGHGWANYAATYFDDVSRFFEQFYHKMKSGGVLVWVVGNSVLQGIEVKTDRFTAEIAEHHNFKKEAIHRVREKRVGSSIVNTHVRSKPKKPVQLYESALVLRK